MVDGSYLNMTLFYTAAAPLGNTAATQKGRLRRPQSVKEVAGATSLKVYIRRLRPWRGQRLMQSKPCYASAPADLAYMPPNPI